MRVVLTRRAARQFDALPTTVKPLVLRLFERLTAWPAVSGVRRLRGSLAGQCRLRTGDYRVQFLLAADEIVVVRIGHRDRFYED